MMVNLTGGFANSGARTDLVLAAAQGPYLAEVSPICIIDLTSPGVFASLPKRVVCAATLIPRKGQRYLLEALATLKRQGLRVMLSLAGEGQTRPHLEAQADALGVRDQVTLLGNVDHAELLRRYGAGMFGTFVLPSLHEDILVALIEAMSYGLPVVATDVGGTRELLAGDAGILIPAESAAHIVEAPAMFIRQPERRSKMAQTGSARVFEMHDVKRVVDSLERRFGAQGAAQKMVL